MKAALIFAATALLASCSAGFNSKWRAAAATPSRTGPVGAWQGTWHSESTGHRGDLRCVVDPAFNREGDHTFHYHATWGKVLSGGFDAIHRVMPAGGGAFAFEGTHQMPAWAGGRYTYRGTITGDRFKAAYRSSKDHGTFSMQRVQSSPR